MKPAIVFDMNETLLDMSALDPTFAQIFGAADGSELRKKWFKQVLELVLTVTITGEYRSFDELTDDALQMLAAQQQREAGADDRARLEKALTTIPAYPDVAPSLARLKTAGFTLAVLTNSGAKSARTLLDYAGVRDQFDQVLSTDAVKCYKPAREAYEHAAEQLDVKTSQIVLVAAHAWDIAGAQAAGCKAAFVARPEKVLSPGGRKPELEAGDLSTLAERIIAS